MRPLTVLLSIPALLAAGLALAAGAPPAPDAAPPDLWPRELKRDGVTVVVYTPQLDEWNGRRLQAHTVVAVSREGHDKQVFGVVDFTVRTQVDKERRQVTFDEILVFKANFPTADASDEAKLLGGLQKEFNDTVRTVSLDRFEAALAVVEAGRKGALVPVKNDPPDVVFRARPTMLVQVDGAPAWRAVEGTSWERLLNTRPLVLRAAGAHYLHLFDGWLEAPDLAGPWQVSEAKVEGRETARKKALEKQPADLLEGGDPGDEKTPKPTLAKGPVPEVLVVTEPTELVVTEGEPDWTSIAGTELLYVSNTSGNVFKHLSDQQTYVLLSGRWFAGAGLDGPWSHVAQGALPADFATIPDDSPKENVKASVAGTPQAEEATIADGVPQTATVRRDEAKIAPRIDGEPKLESIAGTDLHQVANASVPIVLAGGSYYAVENGVWFVATSPAGPWAVATAVPAEIYTIPASSALHYVTYVRVYESTPEVVVVGYTPGYYGTVVADGVVVYGTGYAYTPWVGTVYYAPPVTWGYSCGIVYTPWSGWAFTFGVAWGWGYWGGWYAPYPTPYWGPYYGWGYPAYGGVAYGPYGGAVAWGPGGWAGTTGNVYRQWGSTTAVSRHSGGYNAWTGNAWRRDMGMAYNSRTGNLAAGQRGAVANVYTGEYAYGGRGAVTNTRTGATVAGGRVTMGDADTGREVTAGRVGGYNPATGEGGSAAWVRGEEGGAARVGDDYFASKDGEIYRRDGQGDWSQVEHSGEWSRVEDQARTRDLERHSSARASGQQRYQNYQRSPRPTNFGGGMRGGARRR